MISCNSTGLRKNETRGDLNCLLYKEVQSCSGITCTEGNVLTLSEVIKKIVTTISQCSNSSTVVVINISSTIHTTSYSNVVTIYIGNFKNFVINNNKLTCKETSCICQGQNSITSSICRTFINSRSSCRQSKCSDKFARFNSTSSGTICTTSNCQSIVCSIDTRCINSNKFSSGCLTSRSSRRSNSQDHTIGKTCVSRYLNSSCASSNVSDINMRQVSISKITTVCCSQCRSSTSDRLTTYRLTNYTLSSKSNV